MCSPLPLLVNNAIQSENENENEFLILFWKETANEMNVLEMQNVEQKMFECENESVKNVNGFLMQSE